MTRDEAEMYVSRVRAALAEIGYSACHCWPEYADETWQIAISGWVPLTHSWTAVLVSGRPVQCWPCRLLVGEGLLERELTCDHDPWTSERPRLERRAS